MIPKHRANTGGVGCVVDYPHIETGQQGHTKRKVKLVNNLRRPNQQQHCAAFGYYTLQCTRLLGGLATSRTASCDLSCHNTIVCRPAEGGWGGGPTQQAWWSMQYTAEVYSNLGATKGLGFSGAGFPDRIGSNRGDDGTLTVPCTTSLSHPYRCNMEEIQQGNTTAGCHLASWSKL